MNGEKSGPSPMTTTIEFSNSQIRLGGAPSGNMIFQGEFAGARTAKRSQQS